MAAWHIVQMGGVLVEKLAEFEKSNM